MRSTQADSGASRLIPAPPRRRHDVQGDVDAFFLEFDSDRAGGFEPLRFLPFGRTAVLGLVTSKTPELEDADRLIARIDEAARYVSLDQLAISPQCGFSSSHHGNELDEDAQWSKLRRVVEVADQVWK